MTAVCLKAFGVFPKDTRDALGREHFLAVHPYDAYSNWFKTPVDFTDRFSFGAKEGPLCCAPFPVLFHKITTAASQAWAFDVAYRKCGNCGGTKAAD